MGTQPLVKWFIFLTERSKGVTQKRKHASSAITNLCSESIPPYTPGSLNLHITRKGHELLGATGSSHAHPLAVWPPGASSSSRRGAPQLHKRTDATAPGSSWGLACPRIIGARCKCSPRPWPSSSEETTTPTVVPTSAGQSRAVPAAALLRAKIVRHENG
jgi:hypothetical protein